MAKICPKGDDCALNKGYSHCKHCGRNWPPDETWEPTSTYLDDPGMRAAHVASIHRG